MNHFHFQLIFLIQSNIIIYHQQSIFGESSTICISTWSSNQDKFWLTIKLNAHFQWPKPIVSVVFCFTNILTLCNAYYRSCQADRRKINNNNNFHCEDVSSSCRYFVIHVVSNEQFSTGIYFLCRLNWLPITQPTI